MPKGAARTRLYLVCSPLGNVGKTTTARLLLDHALSSTFRARGFDTNPIDPTFEHLFPMETTAVDLAATRGQMDFFDRLVVADGAPKVVDLWHGTYDLFWTQADTLRFFPEARAQGIETVVFLQADRKDRFLFELRTLPARSPDLTIVLVHNQGVMKTAGSEAGRRMIAHFNRMLTVPEFDAATQRVVEKPGLLAKAVQPVGEPTDERWVPEGRLLLRRVFDQVKFLELGMG